MKRRGAIAVEVKTGIEIMMVSQLNDSEYRDQADD
jgi:hypothetical protein